MAPTLPPPRGENTAHETGRDRGRRRGDRRLLRARARGGAARRLTLLERGPELASGCSRRERRARLPEPLRPDLESRARSATACAGCGSATARSTSALGLAVLPWLARYTLAARHWEHGSRLIQSLSVPSLELHAQLGEELGTSFEQTGTLSVYATEAGFEAAAHEGEKSGLNFSVLDADETRALEPSITGPVVGGVHYPDEGRVDPKAFVEAVGKAAAAAGVEIRTGVEVSRARRARGGDVVVAAGAWSRDARRPPARGREGLPRRLRVRGRRSEDPRLAAGDADGRDAAAGPAAPLGDARARRARPLDLAAARGRDQARRRPLVPGPRRAAGVRHLGGDPPLPAGRPAGDRRGWTA